MHRTKPLLDVLLHHELIPSKSSKPIVFLHGLLGNGKNLKTLAKKVSERHSMSALLLDLRGHGKSPSTCMGGRPGVATLNNCAKDVLYTLRSLGYHGDNSPVGIVGHSFGGRVTLEFLKEVVLSEKSQLKYGVTAPFAAWILDSVPGAVHSSVGEVVQAVSTLSMPIEGKKTLVDSLKSQNIKHDICAWMTTNLTPDPNYEGKFKFIFDLETIHDVVKDFPRQHFLDVLNNILHHPKTNQEMSSKVHINLVRAGLNTAWSNDLLSQLQKLDNDNKNFKLHTLPQAGHWVHIDDLHGLLKLMES